MSVPHFPQNLSMIASLSLGTREVGYLCAPGMASTLAFVSFWILAPFHADTMVAISHLRWTSTMDTMLENVRLAAHCRNCFLVNTDRLEYRLERSERARSRLHVSKKVNRRIAVTIAIEDCADEENGVEGRWGESMKHRKLARQEFFGHRQW